MIKTSHRLLVSLLGNNECINVIEWYYERERIYNIQLLNYAEWKTIIKELKIKRTI